MTNEQAKRAIKRRRTFQEFIEINDSDIIAREALHDKLERDDMLPDRGDEQLMREFDQLWDVPMMRPFDTIDGS